MTGNHHSNNGGLEADLDEVSLGSPWDSWIHFEKRDKFQKMVARWCTDFDERYIKEIDEFRYLDQGRTIDFEILFGYNYLKQEWNIPDTEIQSLMVSVQTLLPIKNRIPSTSNRKKVHAGMLKCTLDQIRERRSVQNFFSQSPATQESCGGVPPGSGRTQKLSENNLQEYARVLWLSLKILQLPTPINTEMLAKFSEVDDIPIIWKHWHKLSKKRLSGNDHQDGLLEYLLRDKQKNRESDGPVDEWSKKGLDLSESEHTLLCVSAVILVNGLIERFKKAKKDPDFDCNDFLESEHRLALRVHSDGY